MAHHASFPSLVVVDHLLRFYEVPQPSQPGDQFSYILEQPEI